MAESRSRIPLSSPRCLLTRSEKPNLLNLPVEITSLILRSLFRGAVVELTSPYDLLHLQRPRQVNEPNNMLSVFAVGGLAGDLGESIILKEATFLIHNLANFRYRRHGDREDVLSLTTIPQIKHIRYLIIQPPGTEIERTLRAVTKTFSSSSSSLMELTIRFQDYWPEHRDTLDVAFWTGGLSYRIWHASVSHSHRKISDFSLDKLARLKRHYRVVLEIQYWRFEKLDGENSRSENQVCNVQISDGKIVELEVSGDDQIAWRDALVEELKLDDL